ncbi:hypothetical protein BN946_scf184817.g38 [Trametes cinnabarina]|uniref:Anaphase-promoting complex subunit 4 WD40 domain-containing protein n=1 Tax=Pycnoporus cinnabarinus TaxID=5643 RepID=A0A060SAQ6_PYCCI|nr:hypothetical protein BN946_scf184817.g38 [Trametes cinnabarina]
MVTEKLPKAGRLSQAWHRIGIAEHPGYAVNIKFKRLLQDVINTFFTVIDNTDDGEWRAGGHVVFIRYYKVKRRLWFKHVTRAAAGRDERELLSDSSEGYDSLQYSEYYGRADEIGGDGVDITSGGPPDVEGQEFHKDITAALREKNPPIVFVDAGVAALACIEWDETADDGAIVDIERQHAVIWIKFSPDDRRLLTGACDRRALIWNVENINNVTVATVLNGHTASVKGAHYSADGRRASSTQWTQTSPGDYNAKIWDAETGELRHTLEHSGVIWDIAWNAKSLRVVTGSDDKHCKIWSAEWGELLVDMRQHPEPVWRIAVSPNGNRVMSASTHCTIFLCDSWTGEIQHTFEGADPVMEAVAYFPDGSYLAACGKGGEVLVWNTHTGEALPAMRGHTDRATVVQFSLDSLRLASGSDDGLDSARAGPVDKEEYSAAVPIQDVKEGWSEEA